LKTPAMFRTTLALIIIVLAVSCSAPQQQPVVEAQPEQVKIGALLGLSGDIGVSYGQPQKNGVELAVNEVNESNYLGSNRKLKLVVVDAGAGADTAFSAMTKLVETDNVSGIIGPTLSAQAL